MGFTSISTFLFVLITFLFTPFVLSGNSRGVITDALISELESRGTSDVVLELPSVMSSVLSHPSLNLLSGNAKTVKLIQLLQKRTSESQAPFMSFLRELRIEESVTQFWISNKISIKNASLSLVKVLSFLPANFTLRKPHRVHLIRPVRAASEERVQWGLEKIEAPTVWNLFGIRGENVLIAGIDSGVLKDHQALKRNYAHGWYDSISNKATPYDDVGQGTHTMGTIVGQNGIGVAPGAKWIACKAFDSYGDGTDTTVSECAQFVLTFKPTPNVVSNSWGYIRGSTFFNSEILAWRAAGIIPVFAVGDDGNDCETAISPGDQLNVISVGASNINDRIADFSSRGYAKGTHLFKPELTAPGVNIRSAFNKGTSSFATFSGTSMATSHVAGAVALMLSQNRSLEFDEILRRLGRSADRPEVSEDVLACGKADEDWPNNAFGFGRINVRRAFVLFEPQLGEP